MTQLQKLQTKRLKLLERLWKVTREVIEINNEIKTLKK